MKFAVPELSWHNRDPVLSVDFQPVSTFNDQLRLASGGADTHVCIWYVNWSDNGAITFEVVSDLARHQKAVNVVRWSPNGEFLASGDDESIIFIWKQRTDKDPPPIFDQTDEQDRETWIILKTLRGHMEDVYDISWSPTSAQLASGSVDNTVICWEINSNKGKTILKDHKGFVQGVSWDPLNIYIATMSSDRTFRVFDATNKKVVSRSNKAVLPFPSTHPLHNASLRLYYDDTLQTYFRRLHFSPDGMLIAVPSGYLESDQDRQFKPLHAVHIYTRYSLKIPACVLPCGDAPALAVRWSPVTYKLRKSGPKPAFAIGENRMVLAVATKTSIIVYDTQQKSPVAFVSNIHYTRLTDLTWSRDGRILIASSTDGFCSVTTFSEHELGEKAEIVKPIENYENVVATAEKGVTQENSAVQTLNEGAENKVNMIAVKRRPTESKPQSMDVVADDEKLVTQENSAVRKFNESAEKKVNIIAVKRRPIEGKPQSMDVVADDEELVIQENSAVQKLNESAEKKVNMIAVKRRPTESKPQSMDVVADDEELVIQENSAVQKFNESAEKKVNMIAVKRKPTQSKAQSMNVIVIKDDANIPPKENKTQDPLLNFKAPKKSPKKLFNDKKTTPVNIDAMDETAMLGWSDDSNSVKNKQKQVMAIDDNTEDFKLIYEDTRTNQENSVKTVAGESIPKENKSEEAVAKLLASESIVKANKPMEKSVISSPKTPRRVSFVTLSSPKQNR